MKTWMNMRHNVFETLLGAVILAVAGFFVVQTYQATGQGVGEGYHVIAYFDRIDGVMPGTDVKVSGVKVGSVASVRMEKETYRAQVTLHIEKSLKIPEDSSAEIMSESLLGGKYVTIVPGVESTFLTPNSTIRQTTSSVNFETLLSKFVMDSGNKDTSKGHG